MCMLLQTGVDLKDSENLNALAQVTYPTIPIFRTEVVVRCKELSPYKIDLRDIENQKHNYRKLDRNSNALLIQYIQKISDICQCSFENPPPSVYFFDPPLIKVYAWRTKADSDPPAHEIYVHIRISCDPTRL